jgi:hypothetical protein
MRKKLVESINRSKIKLSNFKNNSSSSFGFKAIEIMKEENPNQSSYNQNALRLGETKKLKSLQISSLKNYDNKDFFNDEYSKKNQRNFKYNSNELVKGTRLFNKIMSTDRKGHILRILDSFDREHIEIGNNIPLDLHLRKYFLKFKFVKSSDREFISDQVYNLIRYKGLIDFLTKPPLNWFSRFDNFYNSNFELQKKNVNVPA